MNIIVTGFPFVRPNYLETFDYFPSGNRLFFLLPKKWKIKNGSFIYNPPQKENIYQTLAFFHHSHYPLVGGLLKGFMPLFPFYLLYLRLFKKIEIVYTVSEPNLLTTVYFSFWSKMAGCKNILFSWENIAYNTKFHGFNLKIKEALIRASLALSDGIICGNQKCAKIFSRYTKKPIAVIPMSGVNQDLFRPVSQQKEIGGVNLDGKLVFTFAGAIDRRKNLKIFIQAFFNLLDRIPESRLVIIGSGDPVYEKEISHLIDSLGIVDRVVSIHWVANAVLFKILSCSDIFLYPSSATHGWEEQFGYSMAEASLMELPVISTKTGSIEEVVVDGETGILVSHDNLNELEDAMFRLARDPELRRSMGQKGREYVIRNFSHQVISEKIHHFFQEIVNS